MHRAWGVLASAAIAAALEIAVNLVANSVTVPRRYYFVPVGAFIVLVGMQFALALRKQHAPANRKTHPGVRAASGRHLIKGVWHKPSQAMVAFIGMVAALCLLLDVYLSVWKERVAMLIVTLFFAVLLAALCSWVALGSRVSLEFSIDGVAVRRTIGRKRRLHWNEATDFHTDRDNFVASPVSDSTWYLHGWKFDDRNDVIQICDLWRAGISPAAVDAAIRHWNNARRSMARSDESGQSSDKEE